MDAPTGQPPPPPAQLALATILQADTGGSDDAVSEATTIDRRWQLVRDDLDGDAPPFSKGTLQALRQRLIATPLDRLRLERTVEVAATTGAVGSRPLRAALSSRPLWGAGRVEATANLLGHARRKARGVMARQQGRGLAELAAETGATVVVGSSLNAALDLDWDDPAARDQALLRVLDALTRLAGYLDHQPEVLAAAPHALVGLASAQQVRGQAVTVSDSGTPTLRDGVAADRRISALRTASCATGARVAASSLLATNGTCGATWTVGGCRPWA